MTTSINRFCKGIMDRPAISQSAANGVGVHVQSFCPLGDSQSQAVVLKPAIASHIRMLLTVCCPATILRRIWTIIIDTVQGHSFWPFAHIRKEVSETATPPGTNGDTTSTIIVILSRVWVVATGLHLSIGWAHRMITQTMLEHLLCSKFALKASAALAQTFRKVRRAHSVLVAAVTTTEPIVISVCGCVREHDDGPSSKSLPSQIIHGCLRDTVYHRSECGASSDGGKATAMAAL